MYNGIWLEDSQCMGYRQLYGHKIGRYVICFGIGKCCWDTTTFDDCLLWSAILNVASVLDRVQILVTSRARSIVQDKAGQLFNLSSFSRLVSEDYRNFYVVFRWWIIFYHDFHIFPNPCADFPTLFMVALGRVLIKNRNKSEQNIGHAILFRISCLFLPAHSYYDRHPPSSGNCEPHAI